MEEENKQVTPEANDSNETQPKAETPIINTISEMNEEEIRLEKADAEYTAENIQVLDGLEAVRTRPGMYIGTTAEAGLHHLVWEIVDNSVDEALAGYCTEVNVVINADETITVTDNGRGIPVDIVSKSGKSALETVFTMLHAGGKFGEGDVYKVAGGLHGVGASVVNALSEWLKVTVHKDGGIYFMSFVNGGQVDEQLHQIGTCNDTGTSVTFKPDPKIFVETTTYSYETIKDRMQQLAYLNRGIRITVEDKRAGREQKQSFYYEGGIKEYVQ